MIYTLIPQFEVFVRKIWTPRDKWREGWRQTQRDGKRDKQERVRAEEAASRAIFSLQLCESLWNSVENTQW